jgi:hypothetical protein
MVKVQRINNSICFPVLIQIENAKVRNTDCVCVSVSVFVEGRRTGKIPTEWRQMHNDELLFLVFYLILLRQ